MGGEVYEDGSQEFSMFEDDGHFHIQQFGVRGAFDIGQDIGNYRPMPRSRFNREANQFVRGMGYSVRYEGHGAV